MKRSPTLLAVCAAAALLGPGSAAAQHDLDVSRVTAVRVTGAASHIDLSASATGTYRASLGARHLGWLSWWYSSWFFNACSTTSRMWLRGTTLHIDVTPQPFSSDCTVVIRAHLPANVGVSITQAAVDAHLHGDFSSIRLDGAAANFTFAGDLRDLDLHSRAMHARLKFVRVRRNETLRIDAKSLAADIAFPRGTRISYDVRADAALVNSSLGNTPGAKPAIAITGDYVMATIR